MKLDRSAVVISLLALAAAACGADRSKDLRQAETKLTSAQVDARNEEAQLQQSQERERARSEPMSPERSAELRRRQTDVSASKQDRDAKAIADAQEDVSNAQAALATDRAEVASDARQRLLKADARLDEARTKAGKLSAGKRAQLDAEVNTYYGKRAEAQKQLSDLPKVKDSDWTKAKKTLEKTLDDAEAAIKRALKDL